MSFRFSLRQFIPSVAAGLAACIIAAPHLATEAHGGTQHPVTINEGSCSSIGSVIIPLGDAGNEFPVDGVASESDHQGADTAVQVDGSLTKVAMTFSELVASPHAIVIHSSADDVDELIACGDIGGRLIGTSQFPVGLAEVDESGTWGVAILQDNGDGSTEVGIYVVKDESAEHEGHDHDHASEATPAS